MIKDIIIIIKKEFRRFFTDRRMLISLLLPGLVIYIIYSLMGGMISDLGGVDADYKFRTAVINPPAEFESDPGFDLLFSGLFEYADEGEPQEEILGLIADKEYDLLVVYDANFYEEMTVYSPGSGQAAPLVQIYYNSSRPQSYAAYTAYVAVLDAFEQSIANKFDINRGGTGFDLASAEDSTIQVVAMLVPFLMIMLLFSGAMAISVESIAGEKERGTIATLLVTPVNRSHIALGKIIALGTISLVSASSSFLGLLLSLPKLMGETSVRLDIYKIDTYLLLFTVLVSTVLIFVVLISIISAYSKSIKEATALIMPVMILNLLVGISSMTGLTANTFYSYLIPVYNSVQCLTSILSLEFSALNLTLTILSNLAAVAAGVWGLTKMFNSEKVMFNR